MAIEHATHGSVIDLGSFGDGKTTAVVKESLFEVIRVVVHPGKPFPEHKVDGPITVQCLSGSCNFSIEQKPSELKAGSWLYLDGGVKHAIDASEECVLLVTILFAAKT